MQPMHIFMEFRTGKFVLFTKVQYLAKHFRIQIVFIDFIPRSIVAHDPAIQIISV